MSIDTQQAITGFIATEPRLTYTEDGTARFYARIGIEQSQQTQTEVSHSSTRPSTT